MSTITSSLPAPDAAKVAEVALRALATVKRRPSVRTVRVRVADERAEVILPREAFDLLLKILSEMAEGNAVTIVPVTAELTTQQAADLLQVSRPYLVRLLDTGTIPFRMVGTHRRVLAHHVFEYRDQLRAGSEKVREDLDALAQKHGLGY